MLERQRAHLLRQADGVAACVRAEGTAAAAEQIDAGRAVARGASALLPIHLLAGAVDVRPVLHLMRAALTFRQLPDDATVNDVGARFEPENGIGQLDGASLLAFERGDFKLHITRPSSASCRRPAWLRPWAQQAWLSPPCAEPVPMLASALPQLAALAL